MLLYKENELLAELSSTSLFEADSKNFPLKSLMTEGGGSGRVESGPAPATVQQTGEEGGLNPEKLAYILIGVSD